MLKRALMLFVLILIFGISCGGIYQLTLGSGEITAPAFITRQIEKYEAEKVEKEKLLQAKREREKEVSEMLKAEKLEREEKERNGETVSSKPGVTNHRKSCDTPGCDRSVFVEYEGMHLCVKCYAKLKNSEKQ